VPDRHAGVHVEPEDRAHVRRLQRAVLDHARRTGAALLGRLEQQLHVPTRWALTRQQRRRPEQHGGVGVVAAQVGHPRHRRRVGHVVGLLDGQRVHIGAQRHGRAVGTALDQAGEAGASRQGRRGPQAEFVQALTHEGGGGVLLVGELGMGVQVTAPGDEVGSQVVGGAARVHGASSGDRTNEGIGERTRVEEGAPATTAGYHPSGPRLTGVLASE